MKKGLMILVGMMLFAVSGQAVVYHLEKVNSIVGGEKYVFVDTTYHWALKAENSKALPFESPYATQNLTGDEKYVWQIENIKASDAYYMGAFSLRLKNSGGDFSWTETAAGAGSPWYYEFDAKGTAKIYTLVNPGSENNKYYFYYYTSSSGYKTKLTSPYAAFSVYRLVPDTYERTTAVGQLGTICLPYAVEKVTGAEVFELTYLEKDGQGDPYNVYYTEVEATPETPLTAGKPYLFMPQAAKVQFQKASTTTENSPQNYKGFYGTFTDIIDGSVLEGKYMINNQNQFQLCGAGCGLKANRGYFDLSQTPTEKPANAAQRRQLVMTPEGVEYIAPKGIGTELEEIGRRNEEVRKYMVDGKLYVEREGGVRLQVTGCRL